ncbi:MAG: type II toxin-antitoxin system VapC family toxin [Synechococcus sp.]
MLPLDTNVIAKLMRPEPEPAVLAWADQLDPDAVGITTMNEAEILHGQARLPQGKRLQALQSRWEQLVPALFADRVFPFDREAAHWYADLLQWRLSLGRPMATADAVIAAMALAIGASLATRNTADFAGVGLTLINPWPGA